MHETALRKQDKERWATIMTPSPHLAVSAVPSSKQADSAFRARWTYPSTCEQGRGGVEQWYSQRGVQGVRPKVDGYSPPLAWFSCPHRRLFFIIAGPRIGEPSHDQGAFTRKRCGGLEAAAFSSLQCEMGEFPPGWTRWYFGRKKASLLSLQRPVIFHSLVYRLPNGPPPP